MAHLFNKYYRFPETSHHRHAPPGHYWREAPPQVVFLEPAPPPPPPPMPTNHHMWRDSVIPSIYVLSPTRLTVWRWLVAGFSSPDPFAAFFAKRAKTEVKSIHTSFETRRERPSCSLSRRQTFVPEVKEPFPEYRPSKAPKVLGHPDPAPPSSLAFLCLSCLVLSCLVCQGTADPCHRGKIRASPHQGLRTADGRGGCEPDRPCLNSPSGMARESPSSRYIECQHRGETR